MHLHLLAQFVCFLALSVSLRAQNSSGPQSDEGSDALERNFILEPGIATSLTIDPGEWNSSFQVWHPNPDQGHGGILPKTGRRVPSARIPSFDALCRARDKEYRAAADGWNRVCWNKKVYSINCVEWGAENPRVVMEISFACLVGEWCLTVDKNNRAVPRANAKGQDSYSVLCVKSAAHQKTTLPIFQHGEDIQYISFPYRPPQNAKRMFGALEIGDGENVPGWDYDCVYEFRYGLQWPIAHSYKLGACKYVWAGEPMEQPWQLAMSHDLPDTQAQIWVAQVLLNAKKLSKSYDIDVDFGFI